MKFITLRNEAPFKSREVIQLVVSHPVQGQGISAEEIVERHFGWPQRSVRMANRNDDDDSSRALPLLLRLCDIDVYQETFQT